MASEGEETSVLYDNLSNIKVEYNDCEETEDIRSSDKQSEEDSSDHYEIRKRKIRRMLSLPSDTEESDEDHSVDWSSDHSEEWFDFDLSKIKNKFVGSPGPSVLPKDIQNIENVVELFIGNDFFEFISTETNRYYNQNSNRRKPDNKSTKFVDVMPTELKKWFGLIILMGIVKKPRMEDYWSTNPLMETPIFHKTMSRNRFRQILSFLHFSNDNDKPDNADRFFKVQTVIDYFSKKFQKNGILGQDINKMIRIISTVRNADLIDAEENCKKSNRTVKKSKSALEFNKYVTDHFHSYYPIYRKTIKWSKKVVFYLLNYALYNAYKLHQCYSAEYKSLSFHDFLLKICTYWIKDHLPATEENLEVSTISSRVSNHSMDRLSGQIKQHQLIQISKTNKRKRRRCHVCYKNKKIRTTNLMCKSCGVALHLGDCFASYHLKENY